MRIFLVITTLLISVSGVSAQTQLPAPSCEQLKTAYDILTRRPFSVEDGSLAIAVKALADNKLVATDKRNPTEYASQEFLANWLATQTRMDALVWVGSMFEFVRTGLKAMRCTFEEKDIVLMAPKNPVAPTCKAPAELPKKLLD